MKIVASNVGPAQSSCSDLSLLELLSGHNLYCLPLQIISFLYLIICYIGKNRIKITYLIFGITKFSKLSFFVTVLSISVTTTHIFMRPIPFLIIKEKVLEGCWKSKTGLINTFNLFFNKTAEEEARLTHLIVTSLAGVICSWLTGIVVFIFLVV